jgi:putative addiction module component (TIGR02574 family)
MVEKLNKITDQVMSLPPDARALLAHKLWDSLCDFADPDIERLWLEEAEKRWQEIEEGKVECIPAETVMMKSCHKRLIERKISGHNFQNSQKVH